MRHPAFLGLRREHKKPTDVVPKEMNPCSVRIELVNKSFQSNRRAVALPKAERFLDCAKRVSEALVSGLTPMAR